MAIPNDLQLYEKAKEEVYAKYKKPSAYRSMALIKKYKELGGTFSGEKKKGKLYKWEKEKWKDIGKKEYPVFRPTIKVDKTTPLTVEEIDPKNLKEQIKLKQKIKGKKNLPPFKHREEWLSIDGYDMVGSERPTGEAMVGEGIKVPTFITNTIEKVKKVFNKREYGLLPPSARNVLSRHKDDVVSSIIIVRTPIESFINGLLNIISFGEYDKAVQKASYDNMFHLALFINNRFLLDKQAVIHLDEINPIKKNSQVMEVPLKDKKITLSQLIDNTKELMGDRAFSNYNSRSNNCQDFVVAVLNANGLSTDGIYQFVKQDAEKVFQQLPKETETIANALTDLGAVADRFIEGEGEKKMLNKNKMPYEIIKKENGKYEVINKDTKEVHSYGTTKKKAMSQLKLLRAIAHGWKPSKEGGDLIEGNYHIIKNGDCWTLYNTLNKKVIEPCLPSEERAKEIMKGLLEGDRKQDTKKIIEKHRKILHDDSIKKINNNKSKMTWIEFYKKETKGKKFPGGRQEINAWMRECAKKYRAMQGK